MTQGLVYLATKSIERALKTHPALFPPRDAVEDYWQGNGYFATTFHKLCADLRRLPTQEEAVAAYMALQGETERKDWGKINRVRQFYCGFVREIHAFALLMESALFDALVWEQEQDTQHGVDFWVCIADGLYPVAARRSTNWRNKKRWRKRDVDIDPIDWILTDLPARRVGGVDLFTLPHVRLLYARLTGSEGAQLNLL